MLQKNDLIFDVNLDQFDELVIQASKVKPVLVDLWAEWCSPCLVIAPLLKKLVEEYGDDSVSVAFLIPNSFSKYYLDYLLRKYKGDFYRNRYPSISFVQT